MHHPFFPFRYQPAMLVKQRASASMDLLHYVFIFQFRIVECVAIRSTRCLLKGIGQKPDAGQIRTQRLNDIER